MVATRPTSTPRSFTLPPGSMTRPDLSDFSVTGTNEENDPLKNPAVMRTEPTMTATRIAVHHEGHEHRNAVQRYHDEHSRDDACRSQVGDRTDAHDLECVDFLGDPHRTQLCSGPGAYGGRQSDTGVQRCNDAHVQVGGNESGQRFNANTGQQVVALNGDECSSRQGKEPNADD